MMGTQRRTLPLLERAGLEIGFIDFLSVGRTHSVVPAAPTLPKFGASKIQSFDLLSQA
jgi:hypothetical protein